MSTTDYTIELEALKSALHQLDQEELDLNHAMQTYQQGLKHHERCVNTLTKLEQSMDKDIHNVDVEPIELSLKDVFTVTRRYRAMPSKNFRKATIENCIELLVQAERILSAGYRQIDLASETLSNAIENSTHSAVSNPCTEEVHRV